MNDVDTAKSRGLELLRKCQIEQVFLEYLTQQGSVKDHHRQELRALLTHPGWRIFESFLAHYILRDSITLVATDSDPEVASTPNLPQLDGALWAARIARKAGKIDGLVMALSLPKVLSENADQLEGSK